MSNFKSGSGNLDFGDDDAETDNSNETSDSDSPTDEAEAAGNNPSPSVANLSDDPPSAPTSSSPSEQYPYFVRRNNVGDERDTRLEIHVRDNVADNETAFRNELADQLDVNEVSKTDAREFALLAAFQHPERVAELMEEDGFGALNR